MKNHPHRALLERKNSIPVNHCGVSQLAIAGLEAEVQLLRIQAEKGSRMFGDPEVTQCQKRFREAGAKLFATAAENISYIDNVAYGLNIIAQGFPWKQGDTVLLYDREYPSNVFPWQRPGLDAPFKVKFVSGTTFEGRAHKIPFEAFEAAIDSSTRVIAVSHVQFMSGYAVDLERLGALCKQRGITLIVDAAQSAGCIPVTPEKWNVDVVVSSGWKWLLGPIGSGIMYTSPSLRAQMGPGLFGPDQRREEHYEDLAFTLVDHGGKFEPSTLAKAQVAGLTGAIEAILERHQPAEIWPEIKRLQAMLLERLDTKHLTQVPLDEGERSGILSFVSTAAPQKVVAALAERGVTLPAPRGDYLRLAPHFFLEDEEVVQVAEQINAVVASLV